MSEKSWYRHPIEKDRWIPKKEYFELIFGSEYMESNEKGTLKEYKS